MKPKLVLCLALVLSGGLFGCPSITRANEMVTNSPALANSEQDFELLVKLVEQKDFYAAQKFYYQKNGAFTLEQRNAVFLLVAQLLVITNSAHNSNPASSSDGEVDTASMYFLNSLVGDYNYITILDGISYEDHGITRPDAIPYLIEGLKVTENGDPRFIDGNSKIIFQILWCLTHRNTGYVNGDDHFFAKNHKAVIDWWQKWWQENKDRHPIYDGDLQKILRDEVLKIDEKIQLTKPIPDFRWDSSARFALEHNGRLDSEGEGNGGSRNSLFTFYYGHAPGNIYTGGGYSPNRGDDVLYVRGEFLTEWLPEKDEPIYGTTFSGKKFPMQEVFSQTVKDTGIAIKVQIATTNTALINFLREKLKE